jgi:RNA polymerase sigma factor (sigma-70 family)
MQGTSATERGGGGARKRAAVEMIAEHGASLQATARRFSIDPDDAEDAYQRALEIVLTKAPTTSPRDLIRWTHTVIRHEALAVRQGRERLHGYRSRGREEPGFDPVANLVAPGEAPDEQVERREEIARSREALRALKPAELRALSLLAEGYSYAEIGELTGFSRTKVNRVLAEGRDRFRSLFSSSEDGSRCRELRPLLSAFCDGEASSDRAETVREHLRACARCRSTVRAYRAAPRIALVLTPALPPSRSLLERAQELLAGLGSRLHGVGVAGDSVAAQIAVVACVTAGVLPAPHLQPKREVAPAIERPAAPSPIAAPAAPAGTVDRRRTAAQPAAEAPPAEEIEEARPEAIEYVPPPPAPPPPSTAESPSPAPSSGSAAGEFGP